MYHHGWFNDLTVVRPLSKLRVLSITNTSVHDLSPLGALPQLKALDMSRTRVHNIDVLSALVDLERLDISNCRSTRGDDDALDLTPLVALRQLKTLDMRCLLEVSYYEWFTEPPQRQLSALKLSLWDDDDGMFGAKSFPHLESLEVDLEGPAKSDAVALNFPHVSSLAQLKNLTVHQQYCEVYLTNLQLAPPSLVWLERL